MIDLDDGIQKIVKKKAVDLDLTQQEFIIQSINEKLKR